MSTSLLKKFIFVTFLFLVVPNFSHAESIELRASSLYPAVGDNVSVTVSSFDIDINNAEVSWYKDGKFDRKGVGMKSYNFIIGENGNTIRASVKVKNQVIEQTIKINPSSVDILWEVVGAYEPPFYKGKITPIKGSSIRVVAIPQIKNERGYVLDPSLFVYAWRKDGSNAPGQSGYGVNSFVYSPSVLDKENRVEVSATGFSRSLAKSVSVAPASSELHFYENSLAYGPLYNKAIKDNQTFSKKTLNIVAEPYFIFTNNLNDSSLKTEWRINRQVTPTETKNSIILSIANNVNSIDLGFSTDNSAQLLQKNGRTLRLNFLSNE